MGIYKYEEITGQIINASHTVQEKQIEVKYDNQIVGEYFADIVVDNKVIVEIKAAERHDPAFEAQLLNYLKATGLEVGLVINFGTSVFVKRMVL